MRDESAMEDHAAKPVALAVLAAALLPWLFLEAFKGINPDTYWLTIGAGRLLHRMKMSDAVYDPNLPLSFLIHAPLYEIWHRLPTEYPIAVLAFTLFYLLLAMLVVHRLARKLMGDEFACALNVSFLMASTLLCTSEFGQRDQLILFGLLPVTLGQTVLTRRAACPPILLKGVFFAGALFILLKPHYLIVPAAFLLHRIYVRRRLSVIFDPDAVILAIAVFLYAVLVLWRFHDYAMVIFPDALKLYVGGTFDRLIVSRACFYLAVYATSLVAVRVAIHENGTCRTAAQTLLGCAALCLIPYLVQRKGFGYHIIPAQTFFWIGIGLTFFALVRRFLSQSLSIALLIALFAVGGFFVERPLSYPSGEEVTSFPLTREISKCDGCRVVFLNTDIRATMMTSYYAHVAYVSRFPSLWFMPALVGMKPGLEKDKIFHKYARLLAEDVRKADILVECLDGLDYVDYFSRDADFAAAAGLLKPIGATSIDYDSYYPGTAKRMQAFSCKIFRVSEK